MFSSSGVSKELRLVISVIIIYIIFVRWGYLQEKITSTTYHRDLDPEQRMLWSFPFALNFVMSAASVVVAVVAEYIQALFTSSKSSAEASSSSSGKVVAPFQAYWRAALTNTIASPIGYASLKYISYPLMILTKSSKPVPVILIGVVYYGKSYKWYKYLSVALICLGIALFSSSKKKASNSTSDSPIPMLDLSIGIVLVLCNLCLDGYTNNEQDLIFSKYESSSLQLMKYINVWQVIYLLCILVATAIVHQESSELILSLQMTIQSTRLQFDLLEFCICAGVGQLLIFQIMKDFGSLAWVTISVTRKLFTILVSVIMFSHPVKMIQWTGIACVFVGMSIDMYLGSLEKTKKAPAGVAVDDKQKAE
jgi:solute carrier family 35 (UDP-galactose transporter), member B1